MDLPNNPVAIDSGTVSLEITPPSGVSVLVNDVPSSYLDLADPGFLAFEYFQQMDAVAAALFPVPMPLRALHLGAAGYSLARAWDFERPGSRQVAVDIDARLVEYVRKWFALPAAPALRIRAQSASDAVTTSKPDFYDIVVRDVFSGDITPHSLTQAAFVADMARILKPDGLYLVNCAHKESLKIARQELKTISQFFPHSAAIAEIGVMSGKRFGNIVLAASLMETNPFESPILARSLRSLPTPAKLLAGSMIS